MPFLFWIVPYLIGGGVLWLIACQTAPLGREIKLSHGILAAILMGLCDVASADWLRPLIGHWQILVVLAAWVLVAMLAFEFSFRRSLVAVLAYFVVIVGVQLGIHLLANVKPPV